MLIGRHSYALSDGRSCNLERTVGFCSDCDAFVPVEDLDVDQARSRIVDAMRERDEKLAAYQKASQTFWAKLGFLSADAKREKANYEHFQNKISELTTHLEICTARSGSPRCLSCGSLSVCAFVLPSASDFAASPTLKIPFPHSGCASPIEVTQSRLRIKFRERAPRYFDFEGTELFP